MSIHGEWRFSVQVLSNRIDYLTIIEELITCKLFLCAMFNVQITQLFWFRYFIFISVPFQTRFQSSTILQWRSIDFGKQSLAESYGEEISFWMTCSVWSAIYRLIKEWKQTKNLKKKFDKVELNYCLFFCSSSVYHASENLLIVPAGY